MFPVAQLRNGWHLITFKRWTYQSGWIVILITAAGESKGQHYRCNYGPGCFSGQDVRSPPQPRGARLAPPDSWEPAAPERRRRKAEFCVTMIRCQTTGTDGLSEGESGRILMLAAFKVPWGHVIPSFDVCFFFFNLLNS